MIVMAGCVLSQMVGIVSRRGSRRKFARLPQKIVDVETEKDFDNLFG
jgi:hypothetical protein